jgi:hypothetical protein
VKFSAATDAALLRRFAYNRCPLDNRCNANNSKLYETMGTFNFAAGERKN